jgi:LacI family transcriptional regulator
MAKKKSIGDLADELGISRTTVSFVLNGKAEQHKISKATQDKVLDLVKKWNYKPNSAARNLRLGRSHTIGLVVPDISNAFFGKIARLLEEYASENGYHVVFGSTAEKVDREREIVESMRQQGVDGILLASADVYAEHVQGLLDDDFPLVLFDRVGTQAPLNVSSVVVENKYGMHQITKHLIDQGCRRIGLLTLTPDRSVIATRIEGYKDALTEAGLPVEDELILDVDYYNSKNAGDFNVKQCISDAFEQLFSLDGGVDGVAFVNNILAAEGIWVVNMYHKDKVNSLRFASFDNIPLFDYAIPPVSGVKQPSRDVVEKCFDILRQHIKDPSCACQKLVLMPKLFLR